MSFPYHAPYWTAVADFLDRHRTAGETLLGPAIFWWRVERLELYSGTYRDPERAYAWAIIHKGQLGEIERAVLHRLLRELRPVFANEVFVVLSARKLPWIAEHDVHVQALRQQVARYDRLEIAPQPPPAAEGVPEQPVDVLPEPGAIFKFEGLDQAELRRAMDQFWLAGGYEYRTLRDKTYYAETDHHTRAFLPSGSALSRLSLLDIGCGDGRLAALLGSDCGRFVGIDLSRVAVERARRLPLQVADDDERGGDQASRPRLR